MDIDLMSANIFALRSTGQEDDYGVHFDNVVFVLNALDVLAGDTRFVEIRKRKPAHRTLTTIEQVKADYRDREIETRKKYKDEFDKEKQDAQKVAEESVNKFRDLKRRVTELQARGDEIPTELEFEIENAQLQRLVDEQNSKNKIEQIERKHAHELESLDREYNSDVLSEQNFYKYLAVLIPPIAPFIVAMFVFFSRRSQEREGVSKSRLR